MLPDGINAEDLKATYHEGLLPRGFRVDRVKTGLKSAHLDREHWLLAYETVRHVFLTTTVNLVSQNRLFGDLLAERVGFYRRKLPRYSLISASEGAPEWVIRAWLKALRRC
jgi:hypothetical protein